MHCGPKCEVAIHGNCLKHLTEGSMKLMRTWRRRQPKRGHTIEILYWNSNRLIAASGMTFIMLRVYGNNRLIRRQEGRMPILCKKSHNLNLFHKEQHEYLGVGQLSHQIMLKHLGIQKLPYCSKILIRFKANCNIAYLLCGFITGEMRPTHFWQISQQLYPSTILGLKWAYWVMRPPSPLHSLLRWSRV